ncbi:hypothetical protein KI809_20010, partial [Geobacter pelophilus]
AKNVTGLREFAFYGENAFDALVRLSTSLQGVNEGLELIDGTFIRSTMSGANAAYKLTELMGGLDKFSDAIDTYFTTMFSDAEQEGRKAAQAARQVNVAFNEMHLTVPTTREGFRTLVESLDLTRETGQALFASLMNIAESFGTVMDAVDAAYAAQQDLQIRRLRVAGNDASADLLELVIDQQKEYQDYLGKGYDVTELLIVQQLEYEKAVKDVSTTLKESSNEMTIAAEQIKSKLSSAVSAQMQIMTTLKNMLSGDLSTLSPDLKYNQLGSSFRATADRARLGDVSALEGISQIAQEFLTSSRSYNASGPAYAADFALVTQTLAELGGLPTSTEIQIDVAQQQLSKLKEIQASIADGNIDQLTYLKSILGENSGVSTLLEQYLKADQAAKDSATQAAADAQAAAEAERQRIAAEQARAAAVAAEVQVKAREYAQVAMEYSVGKRTGYDSKYDVGPIVNGVSSPNGKIDTGDGIVWLSIANGSGNVTDEIKKMLGISSYDVGSPFIPYDQMAQVHKGEIIVDPASSAVLRKYGIQVNGSGGDNSELVALLKEVITEVRALVRLSGAGHSQQIDKLTALEKVLSGIERDNRQLVNQ